MMDEPFRGLDAMTRALMQEYYVRLFEEHRGTNLFVTSELEEGIFLADRLVVLTNQPCQVKKVMDVNLPRPRTFDMMAMPEYVDIKREVLELLHDEAMKSFATGAVNAADFLEAYSQLGQDQAQPAWRPQVTQRRPNRKRRGIPAFFSSDGQTRQNPSHMLGNGLLRVGAPYVALRVFRLNGVFGHKSGNGGDGHQRPVRIGDADVVGPQIPA